MLCAISGEAPQNPVASRKSGTVFEKRLIESYISENGTDPVTGEDLTTDDLIELKSSRTVRPRPPTLTSIPSLLSTFQNEWDALALETYTLKKQLAQTRQELSTALYQHDAAVRVIARLTRERDEARDALSKIELSAGGGGRGAGAINGDAEMLDGGGELPEDVKQRIDEAQRQLSSTRRKRPVPDDWASGDVISAFGQTAADNANFGSTRILRVDSSGDLMLAGGAQGTAGIYSLSQQSQIKTFGFGKGNVVDAIWWNNRVIAGLSTGAIKIFKDDESTNLGSHSGTVTALSLHPSGDILASVGQDKAYLLYDLRSTKIINRIDIASEPTCGSFHPDGHLFAAGCVDGQIRLFDVKSGDNLATFDAQGPLSDISFSENGTWLAVAVKGSGAVQIWDLRKSSIVTSLEIGGAVSNVRWDYTGQFLATAGASGVTVQQYQKSSKSWSEPLRKAMPCLDVSWGRCAKTLNVLTEQGSLQVLGAK